MWHFIKPILAAPRAASARSCSARFFATTSVRDLQIGDTFHGFELRSKRHASELNCDVIEFDHPRTGAKFVHVDREDTDNVFCVAFRTPVTDSTGVPHILEHTTLCGSEKYPVRDPFFLLLRRSLKTFMNAMTGSDYTLYPFSTQNRQDYRNLLSVYLDSTFFPLLRKADFNQEGHRLEQEDVDDASSPLIFKGVVFNEMKGAMSDSHSLYAHGLNEALFPTSTYKENSGGDPLTIPNLTYEQLTDFHKAHYHPGNALFYSYGSFDPLEHMQTVDTEVLSRFNERKAPSLTAAEPHVDMSSKDDVVLTGPENPIVVDKEKQTIVSISWLCKPLGAFEDMDRHEEDFALRLISALLISGPTSPMYKALIDSNMGSGYAPCTGYDGEGKDATFSIGLSDIKDEDKTKVTDIINDTLATCIDEGFTEERIDAIAHQLEFSLKEVKNHYGISLLYRMLSLWVHEHDVFATTQLSARITNLRANMTKDPTLLQRLLRHHTLDNNHAVTVVMKPDEHFNEKLAEKEAKMLQDRVSELTPAEVAVKHEEALALRKSQDTVQDPNVLPTLTVSDISPEGEYFKVVQDEAKPHQFSTVQPANGVSYFTGLMDLDAVNLTPEERLAVPLYCAYLNRVGAGELNYAALRQALDLYTGDVGVGLVLSPLHDDFGIRKTFLAFHSKALDRNVGKMRDLFHSLIREPRFDDVERLKVLLGMTLSNAANSLQDSGHRYAAMHAAAGLSEYYHVKNELNGIPYVRFLQNLGDVEDQATITKLSALLLSIADKMTAANSKRQFWSDLEFDRVLFTGNEESVKLLKTEMVCEGYMSGRSAPVLNVDKDASDQKSFFPLPIQVNHAAKLLKTVTRAHEDHPALVITAKLMSALYLHREIREKGGAYGGGVSQSSEGAFQFTSFRDPHSLQTIETFCKGGEFMQNGDNFTDVDVNEALLTLFSSIDSPTGISARGMTEFVHNRSAEERQLYRSRLLRVTKDDVLRVSGQYLTPDALEAAPTCILGNQDTVPKEIKENWTIGSLH